MKNWTFEVTIMGEDITGKERPYRKIREVTSKTLSGAIRKLFQEVPNLVQINQVLSQKI